MECPQCPARRTCVASGGWGCGALWGSRWFQLEWAVSLRDNLASTASEDSIALREMVPVAVAAAVWGPQWQGKVILFHSDNQAVVAIVNRTYSKQESIMHLVRCLVFYAARYSFWFKAAHVPGVENKRADHLSRNKLTHFFTSCPQASEDTRTLVPKSLRQAIAGSTPPDWKSENWTRQFKGTSERP